MSDPTSLRSPFRRDLSSPEIDLRHVSETEFEKPRGVNRVEVRPGYARVRVDALAEPVMDARLRVLRAVADAGVSVDFLKLTHDGLSFLCAEGQADAVAAALREWQGGLTVAPGRSIVLVHAVNMRDEEGLIARVVSEAIASGAVLEHLGDMHDRLLLVTTAEDADRLSRRIQLKLTGGDG